MAEPVNTGHLCALLGASHVLPCSSLQAIFLFLLALAGFMRIPHMAPCFFYFVRIGMGFLVLCSKWHAVQLQLPSCTSHMHRPCGCNPLLEGSPHGGRQRLKQFHPLSPTVVKHVSALDPCLSG